MPCVFLKRGHRRAIPSVTLLIRPGFSQHGAGSRPLHRASCIAAVSRPGIGLVSTSIRRRRPIRRSHAAGDDVR